MQFTPTKQSWIGGVIFAVFGYLASGFFSSVGSDFYNQLKNMNFDFSSDSMAILVIFVVIGMAFGIALIVHDIYTQKKKQELQKAGFRRPTFSGLETNPDKIDPETKRKKEDDWKHFPANVDR